MSVVLSVRNLTVAYGEHLALDQATAEFAAGRLIAVVGPNGAGKSTLIKATLGLVPRVAGVVEAFGSPLRGADQRIAYVPQRESVDWDFPVSVLDVALMGTYGRLGWFRRPGRAQVREAKAALEQVGMGGLEHRQIGQLSGGQQQRVFLARALAQHAELYLMDEPLAGVDAATEQAVLAVLGRIRDEGKTVVAVHHELDSVREHFDDVVLLNRKVLAAGPVSTTFTPERLREAYGSRLAFVGGA